MAHDLFDDIVTPSVRVGTHPWYSVPLSIVTHTFLVAVLILVPFMGTYVFPTPETVLAFATPPPTPAAPPPVVDRVPVPAPLKTDILLPDAAPLEAPDRIAEEPAVAPTAPLGPGRLTSVERGNISASLLPSTTTTTTLATPPPTPAKPIPVGGAVREPRKLNHVPPAYPPIARAARREGTVILEATIARDGRVTDARVLRSSDMFDQAAIDAVRQWRYTAPTLNGVPVDVTMTVTVRFTLN